VIVSDESTTRAILTQDGRVLIEQPDGSCRPARSKTDWDRVPAMTEEDIEAAAKAGPDAPPLDDEFWRTARVVIPPPRKHTGIRIDADVLDWFRRQGRGWETRMNAVLRAYYEAHRSGPR
jgi:uncharacterized protein (DUF4415 family)